MEENRIINDGNGNIILQSIKGSKIIININQSPDIYNKINSIPEKYYDQIPKLYEIVEKWTNSIECNFF